MNLNAYVAKSGYCSRRKAATLIKEGKVKVGGVPVLEPWYTINGPQVVTVEGKTLAIERHAYIIFNKPRGVTSTVADRFASKKIVDLVPKGMGRVYPVGRLDLMSRGLIILTNDGELCYRLTHPKFEIEKEYLISVHGKVADDALGGLKSGLEEGGDLLKVKSAAIQSSGAERSVIKVVVCEGKKRHLRRLFSKAGFSVMDLQRVRIGGLGLGGLKEGQYSIMDRDAIYAKALT